MEALSGKKLNFLDPIFLCFEASKVLKDLHLLEMMGMCSGQVVAISSHIQKLDCQFSVHWTSGADDEVCCGQPLVSITGFGGQPAVDWNHVVYGVVLGLSSGEQTQHFLVKMKGIIKKYCSDTHGFWTKMCAKDDLREEQKQNLKWYISLNTDGRQPGL